MSGSSRARPRPSCDRRRPRSWEVRYGRRTSRVRSGPANDDGGRRRRVPRCPAMMVAYGILALVVLQRLAELWHAARNTTALTARGGIEHGRRHYPLIVALHASWLAAIAFGIHRDASVRAFPLVCFVVLQGLRVWVLATLGRYWTTRVITIPSAPLVHRGPFRFLRHPNY